MHQNAPPVNYSFIHSLHENKRKTIGEIVIANDLCYIQIRNANETKYITWNKYIAQKWISFISKHFPFFSFSFCIFVFKFKDNFYLCRNVNCMEISALNMPFSVYGSRFIFFSFVFCILNTKISYLHCPYAFTKQLHNFVGIRWKCGNAYV